MPPALTPEFRVVASKTQVSTNLSDEAVILGLHDNTCYGLGPIGARIWALVLDAHRFAFTDWSLPLGAIVVLEPRAADSARPTVTRTDAASALLSMVPETYAGYLLDAEMRREEFVQLGRLLQHVPVYRAAPSDDASRLSLLVRRIVEAVRL